ncbi:hypothetical protein Ciccas_006762 [Cichlidogyrus casuarinus]|uniref:Uncharacterized protein n=1 Tax=Cichlidogyrus casuarinus TaxID=1844966 RepID=A0ABD2Q4U0_9PLAT
MTHRPWSDDSGLPKSSNFPNFGSFNFPSFFGGGGGGEGGGGGGMGFPSFNFEDFVDKIKQMNEKKDKEEAAKRGETEHDHEHDHDPHYRPGYDDYDPDLGYNPTGPPQSVYAPGGHGNMYPTNYDAAYPVSYNNYAPPPNGQPPYQPYDPLTNENDYVKNCCIIPGETHLYGPPPPPPPPPSSHAPAPYPYR